MRLLVAVALGSLVASAALAQEKPAPAKPEKEKKICRHVGDTGSIMPKRVCHTQTEWAAIDAQEEKGASEMFSRSRSSSAPLTN